MFKKIKKKIKNKLQKNVYIRFLINSGKRFIYEKIFIKYFPNSNGEQCLSILSPYFF